MIDFPGLVTFHLEITNVFTKAIQKKFLFPVPARITFGERIKKIFIFYFIEFDVFGTTINCFSLKADPFCTLC